jgi:nicotinic acid mononucleotide adenylyltransferase
MNFQLFTKTKIEKIKSNHSYGILIEVGAGCPVYNELCQYQNTASKIVMYAESPNSWIYNQFKYKNENVRAISAEICRNFIEQKKNHHGMLINFELVNTIQIANDDKTQTHGWFGLKYLDEIKYYHFTISNKTTDRKYLCEIISKIGLDILASQNNVELLDNGYIDQILDNNLNQLKEETLTVIINGKLNINNINNTITVFTPDNNIIRFNDYLRSIQNSSLTVFKGSFNPIHKQHINLIESARKELKCDNTVLCISVYNRDITKKICAENLLKRIQILNDLGYTVLIDCLGQYHYSYTSMLNNVNFKNIELNYIMGSDIIKRFLLDEDVYIKEKSNKNITDFNNKWDKCNFHYVCRDGVCDVKKHINIDLLNVKHMDIHYNEISSTQIRQLLLNEDYDTLKELVGDEILTLYKKHKI